MANGKDYANTRPISGLLSIDVTALFPVSATPAAFDVPAAKGSINFYGLNAINGETGDVVIRVYDMPAAQVAYLIAASHAPAPVGRYLIPGSYSASGKLGGQFILVGLDLPRYCKNGLSMSCTGGLADNDQTQITIAPLTTIDYSEPNIVSNNWATPNP